MELTKEQERAKELLTLMMSAIINTVREAGPGGAPSGPIYAALMGHGCSLELYQRIMATLVEKRILRQRGHVYYFIGDQVRRGDGA